MAGTNGSDGQSAADYIKAEAERELAAANEIAQKAAAASRSVTTEERKEIEAKLEKVSGLKVRLEDMKATASLTETIDSMNASFNAPAAPAPEAATTLGEAVILSEQFQALKARGFGGKWSTGPIELKGLDYRSLMRSAVQGAKANVTETLSPIVVPQYQPGIVETLFRRLTVQDLPAPGQTDSNQVTYAQETTATNAAAATLEATAKPESTIVLALVNEPVRKVATFLPVSDEMLEDVGQIRSYLDGRLTLFVQHAMEAQLLNGTGTAPQLRGLLQRSGIQTVTTVTPLTAAKAIQGIYDAITQIRTTAFLEPDAIVIHPTNWATIRTAQDLNGQYYGGGPFVGTYGQNGIAPDALWGLPAVVTSAITAGTVLVGAFRSAAQMFLRSGLTVEASNSHQDFFQLNMTALRAEMRAALAVYRPAAFSKITLTA